MIINISSAAEYNDSINRVRQQIQRSERKKGNQGIVKITNGNQSLDVTFNMNDIYLTEFSGTYQGLKKQYECAETDFTYQDRTKINMNRLSREFEDKLSVVLDMRTKGHKAKEALDILAFIIAESLRFKPIQQDLVDSWNSDINPADYDYYLKNWNKGSKLQAEAAAAFNEITNNQDITNINQTIKELQDRLNIIKNPEYHSFVIQYLEMLKKEKEYLIDQIILRNEACDSREVARESFTIEREIKENFQQIEKYRQDLIGLPEKLVSDNKKYKRGQRSTGEIERYLKHSQDYLKKTWLAKVEKSNEDLDAILNGDLPQGTAKKSWVTEMLEEEKNISEVLGLAKV